jgi:GPH family glycoside/pentoside/hexuronide:cation symporter
VIEIAAARSSAVEHTLEPVEPVGTAHPSALRVEPLQAAPTRLEPSEALPLAVLWAYALPSAGQAFMGILFTLYLMKFSTDVLLIPPLWMGSLLTAARVWDGLSDPGAGYLSDRTRSRLGRRRSWMAASAVPLTLAMVMLWSPPLALQGGWLLLWISISLLVYETASTAFAIPHGALGVELTPHYHERTRLFGYRHLIAALGTIAGLAAYYVITHSADARVATFWVALGGGCAFSALVFYAVRRVPERADCKRPSTSPMASFGDVMHNPHARLLVLVYAIENFGSASIGMLTPYVTQYVIKIPDLTVPIILLFAIPQFALTPLWIGLARRFGKKRLWAFSMGATSACFAGLSFVPEGPSFAIFALPFLLGVAAGCGAVVAPSVQADVIDYDEYRTGERKEGAYLAVFNLVRKCAAALPAGLTGVALALTGFQPNVEQTDATKFAMRAITGFAPAICYLIGTVLFLRFSFNEAEHAEVRRALDARN